MRPVTNAFLIDGKPMLAPDEEVQVRYEDIDSAAAGRDQEGYMHRAMVRGKVPSWVFAYSFLTEEEKQYMEGLFGDGDSFLFTHPSRVDASVAEQTRCYRSKYSISWKRANTGLWSGYGFTVIAL